METTESNRLIAEFMGVKMHIDADNPNNYERYVQIPNTSCPNGYHVKEARYDSSWDWLMPVVDKIESLGFWSEIQGGVQAVTIFGKVNTGVDIISEDDKGYTKIQSVYAAVIRFINWHNQNTQPNE